jgi:hypothetical protein
MNNGNRSGFGVVVALAWVACELWVTRYYQVDDALIHLRYAHYLRTQGFLTFDGIHKSGGCSSLLYVGLLSALERWASTPFLPKLFSVAVYVVVLAAVLIFGRREVAQDTRRLWVGLFILFISPMAIRWLCDGMETGWTVLVALILGRVSSARAPGPDRSVGWYALLVVLGFLTVILRVELSLLIAIASIAAALLAVEGTVPWRSNLKALFAIPHRASHLAVGGCLGVMATLYLRGHLLPDSAVAKAAGHVVVGQLWGVARAFAASFSFGLGLLAIWVYSLLVLLKAGAPRHHAASLLIANSVLPVILAATVIRGQYVHGVRYFLWPVVFMIAWNLNVLSQMRLHEESLEGRSWPNRFGSEFALASIASLGLLWAVEAHAVQRIAGDTSRSLLEMRSDHLEALEDKLGVAVDVGAISYFSKAPICDPAGVVNGRQMAQMTFKERAKYCAAQSPAFAYVNATQIGELSPLMNFDSWRLCREYRLSNVGHIDMHYLMLRPDIAAKKSHCWDRR